jgi:DNA-binding GntR family transcriptional regulator
MVVTLHNSAVRFWHYSLSRRPEAQLKLEIELHLEVANAIGKGEAAGAAQAMRHVLGLFPDSLRHFFLANPSEPSGSTAK